MQIVIATYTFAPEIGGVATNVGILAAAFHEAGHDVTVVTSASGPIDGFPYRLIRHPKAAQLFELYRAADILIQSNLSLGLIYPLVVIRRPFALRHHSESAFHISRVPTLRNVLRRWVRSRAHHFVTSHYIGRKSGLRQYTVTSPFADPHHITPEVVRPPAERECLLFVGRVEPEKGIPFLLEHWPVIRRELGITELRIVGDGSLAQSVQRSIENGLEGVNFVGALSRNETAKEMGKAAYVVVPSIWQEPFGAVALEAVAAGTIPIVADRGGLSEAAGPLGIMFNPDDEASFRKALGAARAKRNELLQSRSAWEEHLKKVRNHVARFEPERVVETIISVMKPDNGAAH